MLNFHSETIEKRFGTEQTPSDPVRLLEKNRPINFALLAFWLLLTRPHIISKYTILWQQPMTMNKKSPNNAKGNVQQRCMFESPVKQNLGSPMIATMFFTVARRRQMTGS